MRLVRLSPPGTVLSWNLSRLLTRNCLSIWEYINITIASDYSEGSPTEEFSHWAVKTTEELENKILGGENIRMAIRYAYLPTVEEEANYTHWPDRGLRKNNLWSKDMQEKHTKATACPVFPTWVYNITCRVRRLLSSVWIQARRVNSVIKIWAALAKSTGASALIICNRRRPSLSVTSKSLKPVSLFLSCHWTMGQGLENKYVVASGNSKVK